MFPGEIFRGFHLFLRFTSALSYGSNSLIGLFISARPLSSPLIKHSCILLNGSTCCVWCREKKNQRYRAMVGRILKLLLYAMVAFMGRLFLLSEMKVTMLVRLMFVPFLLLREAKDRCERQSAQPSFIITNLMNDPSLNSLHVSVPREWMPPCLQSSTPSRTDLFVLLTADPHCIIIVLKALLPLSSSRTAYNRSSS